jgi:hypothetical protein
MKCCRCCFVVETEVDSNVVSIDQEAKAIRETELEMRKRHRAMGLKSYSAEETAARQRDKSRRHNSVPRKLVNTLNTSADDFNSFVFNQ